MEAIFIDWNISGLEITIMLLIDIPSLDSLLPHGLLYRTVGTLLKTKYNTMEQPYPLFSMHLFMKCRFLMKEN